jgi:NIPSNAP
MITCHLRYTIDPYKRDEFEAYGRMWIPLVNRFGGIHHGYFLPHEGANNIAYALFSFPSLAEYEIVFGFNFICIVVIVVKQSNIINRLFE